MDRYVFRLPLNAFRSLAIRKPRTTHAHPPLLQSKPPQINASHGPTPPHREAIGHRRNRSDPNPGRGQSPHGLPSRSSSTSIDDMLIVAPVAHDHQPLPPGQSDYPSPPLHPQTNNIHPPHPPRSPPLTQSHGTSVRTYPGPGQGAGVHSCQAHTFVPPVTVSPPARTSNTSGMASSLGWGGISVGGSHYYNQLSILR